MKAQVKWTDGRQFIAESGSGHSVVIDGPPDHGGRNTGPRPMEMLLMGMCPLCGLTPLPSGPPNKTALTRMKSPCTMQWATLVSGAISVSYSLMVVLR